MRIGPEACGGEEVWRFAGGEWFGCKQGRRKVQKFYYYVFSFKMQQRFFPTNSLLNHTTLVSLSLATATQKLYGIHQSTIDKPDQNDNLSRALDCACAAWRYISALFCFILALIEPSILLRSGMMISSKTLLSDHQATTTRKL